MNNYFSTDRLIRWLFYLVVGIPFIIYTFVLIYGTFLLLDFHATDVSTRSIPDGLWSALKKNGFIILLMWWYWWIWKKIIEIAYLKNRFKWFFDKLHLFTWSRIPLKVLDTVVAKGHAISKESLKELMKLLK